jgi:hypothetical protein
LQLASVAAAKEHPVPQQYMSAAVTGNSSRCFQKNNLQTRGRQPVGEVRLIQYRYSIGDICN